MNQELIGLYVKGLLLGCFQGCIHSKNFDGFSRMYELEKYAMQSRYKNPEWAEAQKVLNSPLMKALG